MFVVDDTGAAVDAECSLDILEEMPCIVVESSGGAMPSRGVTRRNPGYNKLLTLLFSRLASQGVRLTRVILDSNRVQAMPLTERSVKAPAAYPIALDSCDLVLLRLSLQRELALMHRAPDAVSGGNAQKRLRLCLDRKVSADDIIFPAGATSDHHFIPDITSGLTETEREYIRAARLGQGSFRKSLFQEFAGRCPLTGIENPALLRASHIKPWSKCTNAERLDPKNGLLLSVTADALFDDGLLTFSVGGVAQFSPLLSQEDRDLCGCAQWSALQIKPERAHYLVFHRGIEFRTG